MKILVADDETDILNLMKLQLSAEGYEVLTASDGITAYGLFEKEQVDIAILDIMMPGMDGLTLLRKIREDSQIPVIFITARGDEMDRVAGLSQGADDYLVKPFGLAELSARVAVQIRHLKREKQKERVYHIGETEVDFVTGCIKRAGEKKHDFRHVVEKLFIYDPCVNCDGYRSLYHMHCFF